LLLLALVYKIYRTDVLAETAAAVQTGAHPELLTQFVNARACLLDARGYPYSKKGLSTIGFVPQLLLQPNRNTCGRRWRDWMSFRRRSAKAWSKPTGRLAVRSFEPWSTGSKWRKTRFVSSTESTSPFLPPKLAKNEFCTFVGGVISPLLANLYFRRFVLAWKQFGHERTLRAKIVNYADDLVICCRPGNGPQAMLKEDLRQIWEQETKAAARTKLLDWYHQAMESGVQHLQDFARLRKMLEELRSRELVLNSRRQRHGCEQGWKGR
jgi:hypothetical protein